MPQVEKVRFIDASRWDALDWFSSGGTRAKRVLQNMEEKLWFFKCSEKKPAKDNKPEKHYRYEFWSEIIASQLGMAAGLDMLRYDAAIHGNEIGCISPNMIISETEQLVEMGRYMTAVNSNFLPENTKSRREYTFQLLESTLEEFILNEYRFPCFQTLIFDALIGNTDRHQENWAFIAYSSIKLVPAEKKLSYLQRILNKVMPLEDEDFIDNLSVQELHKWSLQIKAIKSMAPIYDNGSSLGRELQDDRVVQLNKDYAALQQYVNFGRCELHWNAEKISHFEILNNLLHSGCAGELKDASQFLGSIDESMIESIVHDIDRELPSEWKEYCIPDERKSLMRKLVTLRLQKLKELFND